MKPQCATTTELNQAALESASDARHLARRGSFDRMSQVIEHGILVCVVLGALLGNYVSYSHLMRDVLIF